jgi:putative transcriptional regulator
MALAENIKERRTAKGMTTEELAGIVGVTRMAISLFENGERTPSLYNAVRLAEALDTTVENLVNNHEKENDNNE